MYCTMPYVVIISNASIMCPSGICSPLSCEPMTLSRKPLNERCNLKPAPVCPFRGSPANDHS